MIARLLALLLLALCAAPSGAVPLWYVQDDARPGTLLLLGSVHLLRAEDQPLPAAVREAYGRAERVAMELDPAELEPEASRAVLARIGVETPGGSLRDVLDAAQWQRAESLAAAAGLSLQSVAALEPWFATLTLYVAALADAGFDPALGVEQQLADWARRDGKPVTGLETFAQQVAIFKGLELDVQRELLMKTLEELPSMPADAATLVAEWRAGDDAALAGKLDTEFEGYEALRERLVGERNRAWLEPLDALLDAPGVTLVVVGALHLVGPDGLPALFAAQGLQVESLRAP
jgi:uncharacterized protein